MHQCTFSLAPQLKWNGTNVMVHQQGMDTVATPQEWCIHPLGTGNNRCWWFIAFLLIGISSSCKELPLQRFWWFIQGHKGLASLPLLGQLRRPSQHRSYPLGQLRFLLLLYHGSNFLFPNPPFSIPHRSISHHGWIHCPGNCVIKIFLSK